MVNRLKKHDVDERDEIQKKTIACAGGKKSSARMMAQLKAEIENENAA